MCFIKGRLTDVLACFFRGQNSTDYGHCRRIGTFAV